MGACVVNDEKLLLLLRAKDPGAGLWDLPGGFCDPEEHPLATAHREVQEETGLALHSMRFLGMWIDAYGTGVPPEVTLNIYFLGQAHSSELARVSDEPEIVGGSVRSTSRGSLGFRPRRTGHPLLV